ncbi:MAG: YitT family protein [Pseudomonadota bacterium]
MSKLAEDGLHHSPWENAQGIAIGVFIVSLGLLFLKSAGLFVGQAAGIALIGAYLTDTPFGLWFFCVNAPFFLFGARRLGWMFVLRSIIGIAAVSGLSFILPKYIQFDQVHPLAAALASGILAGLGILAALRHGAGLGGVSVMAAAIQAKTGFRAGYVQLIVDALIFIPAFLVFETPIVMYSLFGAIVINGIIAINHRTDWYQPKFD